MSKNINVPLLEAEIYAALVNQKSNACPIACRQAWHAAGTYDKETNTGGSDGATMRFEPEYSHAANAGLVMTIDMLKLVQKKHPEISVSDLWALAGCAAVKFAGGPEIPCGFGRVDKPDGSHCPPEGRLPDATKGAEHLREVFGRMGFNDQEIVALSGGHTLGRCHLVRSGFDGPWTRNPLKFDNEYFRNLMFLEWKPKEWDGPFQYTDVDTETFVMLPTDMALRTDKKFRVWAELYAKDEKKFFEDFRLAYAKLMTVGTNIDPFKDVDTALSAKDKASADFREAAMHGSIEVVQRLASKADPHQKEASSLRTALHKAAFWGHIDTVKYLVRDLGLDVNALDSNGDTALHDAVRFGHIPVVKELLNANTDLSIKNNDGHTPLALSKIYEKPVVQKLLQEKAKL